ncbi:MAG: xanthine dehydrogenase family protein subunit M [Antricoccus sp.]
MRPVDYLRPDDVQQTVEAISTLPGAKLLAGGTNLVDLMRAGIEAPKVLIDVSRLPLDAIEISDDTIRIGATVSNTTLASHPVIRQEMPAIAQAVLTGASGQIRNMATVGGNLMQRTRCLYFYDETTACNKRQPGSGCAAIGGHNRGGAILGGSASCVAVHPSDLAVALRMADAQVEIVGTAGSRLIPLANLHVLPGTSPQIETTLNRDELIIAVHVPRSAILRQSRYRKVRDRASYAFALVSVAAALAVEDGIVSEARVALGGVAAKPWRATILESALIARPATDAEFAQAARAELAAAEAGPSNEFKIHLTERTIVAVLRQLREEGGAA